MNIEEIADAALNGKTFTIKNVHIESIGCGSIQCCIDEFGEPVFVKTVNIKFVSPDIKDSVYSENKDYSDIEVCDTPKYDPCRLFKEGDIVKRRTVDGRTDPDVSEAIDLTVTTGEAKYGNVRVQEPNGRSIVTKSVFLELITPVEELEPYSVDECGYAPTLYVRKNGKVYMTIPYKEGTSLFQTREQALAAAEAERDRLNAEWRKEQE